LGDSSVEGEKGFLSSRPHQQSFQKRKLPTIFYRDPCLGFLSHKNKAPFSVWGRLLERSIFPFISWEPFRRQEGRRAPRCRQRKDETGRKNRNLRRTKRPRRLLGKRGGIRRCPSAVEMRREQKKVVVLHTGKGVTLTWTIGGGKGAATQRRECNCRKKKKKKTSGPWKVGKDCEVLLTSRTWVWQIHLGVGKGRVG